jgi:N-acyl-L-homoserine lactone synthetase
MKILFKLKIPPSQTIYFGEPEDEREKEEMFALRFKVYSSRNYIKDSSYPNKLEFDNYDLENKCVYFIAKFDNILVGSIRVIRDYYLPTEKECFEFEEPEEIKYICRNNRLELSRLIAIPPSENKYFPRHLIMIFLLYCCLLYAKENNIKGGYAFIKSKLEKKLKKINIPFKRILKYKQIYPSNGPLFKYFNNPHDPVVPIYYLTDDIEEWFNGFLRKYFFILKENNINEFVLNKNKFNLFLFISFLKNVFK